MDGSGQSVRTRMVEEGLLQATSKGDYGGGGGGGDRGQRKVWCFELPLRAM